MFEKQGGKNVSSSSLARNKTSPPLLLWMFKANGDKHYFSRFYEEDQSGCMVQGLMRGKLQDTCVLITKTAFGRFIPSKHTEWDTIIALHGLFGILLKGYVLWYTVLNKIGTHWEDILIPVMRFLLRNDCGRSFQTSS